MGTSIITNFPRNFDISYTLPCNSTSVREERGDGFETDAEIPFDVWGSVEDGFCFKFDLSVDEEEVWVDAWIGEIGAEVAVEDFVGGEVGVGFGLGSGSAEWVEGGGGVEGDGGCVVEVAVVWDLGYYCVGSGR